MDAIMAFLGRTSIDLPVIVFRLGLSFVVGAAIGIEREWHRQSAGLRTHMVICLGSTLLTLMSIYLPQTFTHFQAGDPARIAAQVVSGIGFLGGGAIFRMGVNVRGLTTAASIWVVAGLGMVVGAGMYATALIGTALVLVTLFVMVPFEKKLFPSRSLRNLEIAMTGEKVKTDNVFPILERHGIEVKVMDVSQSFEEKQIRMKLTVQVPEEVDWTELYKSLGSVQGIVKITLDQKI
jgi:putative Mg2+ transporter-C (MgtC) family protein